MYISKKEIIVSNATNINYYNVTNDKNGNMIFLFNNYVYYPKSFNLNELIGEHLAEKDELRTVNFECFKYYNYSKEEGIIIASKSFINPTSNYELCTKFYRSSKFDLDILKKDCIDNDNFNKLLLNILKLTAIDVYMGQVDRSSVNTQFEIYDSSFLDLAPCYDYSDSYWDNDFSYENPFFSFKTQEDFEKLFSIYPQSLKLFKQKQNINLIEIIHDIEDTKGFKLSKSVFESYKRKEENSQKKLQKIIK